MNTWSRVIGVLVVLYAAYVVYRGRIGTSDDYSRTTTYITRSEKPVQFWLLVILILAIAALLLFNVFHF